MLTFEFIDRKGTLHKWTKMSLDPTLKGVMKNAMLAIKAHSKAHYLTGPRPQKLGVVNNVLRPSLYTKAEKRGDDVIGRIGTNVWYGYMWESSSNYICGGKYSLHVFHLVQTCQI